MSIKTFINGQENGVITYLGDTEPCAVYVNGERQDNISYIPDVDEGVDSVSYKSEYKNNLRTLQIEGNTEQDYGYQAVEYIESTGTQYIDTGILGKSSLRIVVKTNYAEGALLGTQSNTDTNKSIAIVGASAEYVRFMASGGTQVSANYTSKPPYEIDLSIANFKITSDDGQSYTSPLNGTSTTIDYPMYVFARNIDGQASGFSKRKVYSLKIYDNGTLVRDYIPCYRKSDNVIGLYDLVNGMFYTNAGTGTFLKGADVSTQIGGTTNPTIANPRAITNCGNSQVDIVARGVNLIDYTNTNFSTISATTYTVNDGILNISMKGYYIWFTFEPADAESYTLTQEVLSLSDSADSQLIMSMAYYNTSGTYNEVSKDLVVGKNSLTVYRKEGGVPDRVEVRFFRKKNNTSQATAQIKNIMFCEGVKGKTQITDYEPYFEPTTVSIPANVTLESGANDTLLELAKIGDYADTITIDRIHNEVKYIQRICRVRPFVNVGGTLWYDSYTSQYYNVDLWEFDLDKYTNTGVMKCEFAKVAPITEAETEFCVEIGNTYMIIGIPKSLGITTRDALDSYLMQTGNFGLSIFYALEEPVEWTITDNTESMSSTVKLKTNLLDWAKNTKNQTNIIEITSTPSVSKTSVNYAKWGGKSNV